MKKLTFLFTALLLAVLIGTGTVFAETVQTGGIEEDEAGTDLMETADFASWWEPKGANATSYGRVEEDEEGKYIELGGLYAILSYDEITSPSEFTADLRTNSLSTNIGVCFRTGNIFALYEWDFHVEKGGQGEMSSIGATGIVLSPIEGGIRLSIKTQDSDSTWGISSVYHDFMIEGIDWQKFVPIRIKDDGQKAEVYVNDALLATVEMADAGEYEEDFDTEIFEYLDFTYYKTATVKDAQGNELFKTDKARLVAENFFAGVAVRDISADFRNVSLSFTTPDATEEPQPTPAETADATPEATPETTSETSKPTTPRKTGAAAQGTTDGTDKSDHTGLIIGIAAGAAVIVVLIVVIAVVRKKGKSKS
jgi:hypothetical protein